MTDRTEIVWTHVIVNLLTPVGGGGEVKQEVAIPTALAEAIKTAAGRIGLSKAEFIRRAAVSAALYINEAETKT